MKQKPKFADYEIIFRFIGYETGYMVEWETGVWLNGKVENILDGNNWKKHFVPEKDRAWSDPGILYCHCSVSISSVFFWWQDSSDF